MLPCGTPLVKGPRGGCGGPMFCSKCWASAVRCEEYHGHSMYCHCLQSNQAFVIVDMVRCFFAAHEHGYRALSIVLIILDSTDEVQD